MSTAFNYDPQENPDWNFARTIRFHLRNKLAEFSLSTYSTTFTPPTNSTNLHLTTPNRDYPYEGFLTLTQGENWKFLDTPAFGLLKEGEPLTLHPIKVSASPQLLTYSYSIAGEQSESSLIVTYWLSEQYDAACLNIDYQLTPSKDNADVELVVAPLVDIRHMYAESEPDAHTVIYGRPDGEVILRLEKEGHSLSVVNPSGKNLRLEKVKVRQPWFYKLGSGYRYSAPAGIVFRGQNRNLSIPALIYANFQAGEHLTLSFIAQAETTQPLTQPPTTLTDEMKNEEQTLSHLRRLFPLRSPDPQIYNSILTRIWAFSRFGVQVKPPQAGEKFLVPEAGGWWFRTPWLRDAYLGLLQNLTTLKRLDTGMKIVRDSLLLGIEYFDECTGRVPNLLPYSIFGYKRSGPRTLPTPEHYYTADATLLFFLISQKYIKETKDSRLASKVLETFVKTFQRYREASLDSINGSPVIAENSLLTCVPWHSWTDSKRKIALNELRVKDLAARVPREWQVDELRKGRTPEEVWSLFNRPIFYLPEINALWIRALEAITAISEMNLVNVVNSEVIAEAKNILTSAKENYPRVFWNEGKRFLYDIVSLDLSLRDDTLGSCGIMAASLLRNLLPQDKLESIWTTTKDHLLISRRVTWLKKYMGEVLPFGVIVKDYGERTYFGDEQYHGAIVWPRDTPLLIGLLEQLGATDIIKGLLVSNLDHQMGEGAIFYNHELFSLPTGKNPSPIKESADNPVPVKNPIQFWSQWVDPYLSHEI